MAALTVVASIMAARSDSIVADHGAGTDLGTVVAPGPNYTISGGTQAEANLFHSFNAFSLTGSESATFLNAPSVQNIIGRVNGGLPSSIDGKIETANGNTNLFLINPNGISIGPNARFDISGQLHLSTADYLKLSDGVRFEMGTSGASLTSSAPAAFGFVGPRTGLSGALTMDRSLADQTAGNGWFKAEGLSLTGREIDLRNTNGVNRQPIEVTNGGGVLVGAIQNGAPAGTEISLDLNAPAPTSGDRGSITFTDTLLRSSGSGSADGRAIRLIGGKVTLTNSDFITAQAPVGTTNDFCASFDVCFNFNDGLFPVATGEITYVSGQQGRVTPGNESVALLGSVLNAALGYPQPFFYVDTGLQDIQLASGTYGSAFSLAWGTPRDVVGEVLQFYLGNVLVHQVDATELLAQLGNSGGLLTVSNIVFDHVRMVSPSTSFETDNHAFSLYSSSSLPPIPSGVPINTFSLPTGSVAVTAVRTGDVVIDAGAFRMARDSSISTASAGLGSSGSVTIRGGTVFFGNDLPGLDGFGERVLVETTSNGSGRAGNIEVSGTDITLQRGVYFHTSGAGSALSGDISIAGRNVSLLGVPPLAPPPPPPIHNVFLSAASEGKGAAGDVSITASGDVTIDLAAISTEALGTQADVTREAGDISISALQGKLSLRNSFLVANTNDDDALDPGGDGGITRSGDIDLRAKEIEIYNSRIRTEGGSEGQGRSASGNIFVSATGPCNAYCLTITDSLLTNEELSESQGGLIFLNSPSINIKGRSYIAADSEAEGDAGFVLMGQADLGFMDAATRFGKLDELGSFSLADLTQPDKLAALKPILKAILAIAEIAESDPLNGGTLRGSAIRIEGSSLISASAGSTGNAGSIIFAATTLDILDSSRIVSDAFDRDYIRRANDAFEQNVRKDALPANLSLAPNPAVPSPIQRDNIVYGDVGGTLIVGDVNLIDLLPRFTNLRFGSNQSFADAVDALILFADFFELFGVLNDLDLTRAQYDKITTFLDTRVVPVAGELDNFDTPESIIKYIESLPAGSAGQPFRKNAERVVISGSASVSAINRSGDGTLIAGADTPLDPSDDVTNGGRSGGIGILADVIEISGSAKLLAETGSAIAQPQTFGGFREGGSILFGLSNIPIRSLSILGNASVSTNTYGSARAGQISVHTVGAALGGQVDLSGNGAAGLFSSVKTGANRVLGDGAAGSISIDTGMLTVQGGRIETTAINPSPSGAALGTIRIAASEMFVGAGGLISAETSGGSNAGDILIDAGIVRLAAGEISTATSGDGFGGNIHIGQARPLESITLEAGAKIISTASGAATSLAQAGAIEILSNGGSFSMSGASEISTRAGTSGPGGSITIGGLVSGGGFADVIIRECSRIITEAASANAGDIKIAATGNVFLLESQIVSQVDPGSGSGGDISIDPVFFVMRNSTVDSSSAGGAGGAVLVNTQYFMQSDSVFDLDGGTTDGQLVVTGPEIGTEAVSVLDATILNVLDRLPTECGLRLGRVGGSLTPVGRGGVALVPGENPLADYPGVSVGRTGQAGLWGSVDLAGTNIGIAGGSCN